MPKCLVTFCKNRGEKKSDVHFFKLLENRYESWMKAIGRDPSLEKLSHFNVICSEHFQKEDMVIIPGKKNVQLKESAVPCLKLKGSDYAYNPYKNPPFRQELQMKSPLASPSADPTSHKSIESSFIDRYPIKEEFITIDESIAVFSTADVEDSSRPSPIKLERLETLSASSTSSSLSEPFANIPTDSDSEGLKSTSKKTKRLLQIFHNYCASPRKITKTAKTSMGLEKDKHKQLKTTKQHISSLKDILTEVKRLNLASDHALDMLEKAHSEVPVDLVKRLTENIKKGKVTRKQFPKELRRFAMTLKFYSSKAYYYVRNTFDLALPSPSVIRNWFTNADCTPGFSASAFTTLKAKLQENDSNNTPTICALILDEMAIRKQIDFINGKTWGYVDIGCNVFDDSLNCANQALVFMVVSLNNHWKLPIAYFLIDYLNSAEKANLVNEALRKLDEVGVNVSSLTCDGPNAHFAMAEKLGADFQNIDRIVPYFKHPVNNKKIYIVFDACHMLNLARINWARLRRIRDGENNLIDFGYVEKLAELQEEEGFPFGPKIRKVHMQSHKQTMKVDFAAQSLSGSVADAIEFFMEDIKHPFFRDAAPTINFIRKIDRLFDLCNSRNPFGKGCKTPLKKNNEMFWKPILKECLEYLKSLKNCEGVALHTTPIKGFLIMGFSLLGIYDDYVCPDSSSLNCFLTYKMSQDHLEHFFRNVRSGNSWNKDPTAYEFHCSFRRFFMALTAYERN